MSELVALLYIFAKGLLIGVSIAAPVGPIGLLCIRATLSKGFKSGLCTGFGAATADAFYGAVAAFGLTLVMHFLNEWRVEIALLGAAFLLGLGVRSVMRKEFVQQAADGEVTVLRLRTRTGLATDFAGTLVLTLTNPATLLSFVGIFAGLGVTVADAGAAPYLMVAGVFTGSALWWIFLVTLVARMGRSIKVSTMTMINRISGLILIGFAGLAAISALI